MDDHGCFDASVLAGTVTLHADVFQVPTRHSRYCMVLATARSMENEQQR